MYQEFLKVALEAAKAAQETIGHYFEKVDVDVNYKNDNSPYTSADTEAEKIIKQVIKNAFPSHGFLGEESGIENPNNSFVWTIDPIDGTKNFIRRVPFFSTLIALMHRNEVIVGVSMAPQIQETLYASKNQGVFLNNQPISVSKTTRLEEMYLGYGSLKHFLRARYVEQLLSLARSSMNSKSGLDFFNYHLLAQGKLDVVIEPSTHIWDVAPFDLIIKEAGGSFSDIHGEQITPDTTSAFATNGLLRQAALSKFHRLD
ncbi:MAG: inositol monophosphatase family protein [Patescibacteria group bacterium]